MNLLSKSLIQNFRPSLTTLKRNPGGHHRLAGDKIKHDSRPPQRNTRPAVEPVATPPPSRPALSRPLASHSFPVPFGRIRLPSDYTGDAQGRDEGSLPLPPLHRHPTARVARSPAPSGPLAKAAPSARSGPPHHHHQHRPTAISHAGAAGRFAGARSEAAPRRSLPYP